MNDPERDHRRIVEFIVAESGRTEGRQCVSLTLAKANAGSRGIEIRTWYREEQPDVFEVMERMENLATEIIRIAEEDAQTSGRGNHRYEVRSKQHLGGGQRVAFAVAVDDEESTAPHGRLEAPNAEGLVSQSMRHTEWAFRAMMESHQATTGILARQINEANQRASLLAKEKHRVEAELSTVLSDQEVRQTAALMAANADDRKDLILRELLPLAPMLLSKFKPAGDANAQASVLPEMINRLADTLDSEAVGRIIKGLSPQQQMMFMEVFKTARASEDAKKKEAAALKGAEQAKAASAASAQAAANAGDPKSAT